MTADLYEQVSQLRVMIDSRLTLIEREVYQFKQLPSDVSHAIALAGLASDQATTAVIGEAELRDILRADRRADHAKTRVYVAAIGAAAVVFVGILTFIGSHNAQAMAATCGDIADRHIEKAELRNEARDQRIADKAADRVEQRQRARDQQLELLIRSNTK